MLRLGLHNKYHPYEEHDFSDHELPKLLVGQVDERPEIIYDNHGAVLSSVSPIGNYRFTLKWDDVSLRLQRTLYNIYSNQENGISLITNDNLLVDGNSREFYVYNNVYNPDIKQSTSVYSTRVSTANLISFNQSYLITTNATVGCYAAHTFRVPVFLFNDYPLSGEHEQYNSVYIKNLAISYSGYGYGPNIYTNSTNKYGCQLFVWNAVYNKWDLLGINTASYDDCNHNGLIKTSIRYNKNLYQYIYDTGSKQYVYIQARASYPAYGSEVSAMHTDYIRVVGNAFTCEFSGTLAFADNEYAATFPQLGRTCDIELLEVSHVK
jgi:hypothetical protein